MHEREGWAKVSSRIPSMYMYMYNAILLSYTHSHIYTSIYMLIQTCTHTPHTLTDRSCDVVGWTGARDESGVHEREGWVWVGWIGAHDESGVHEGRLGLGRLDRSTRREGRLGVGKLD